MILQTSPELSPEINENGCYFMSLLFLAGQKTGQSFHTADITRIKSEAEGLNYLRHDCYVLNPAGILSLAGLPATYTNRHEPPSRETSDDEIEVLYYRYEQYGHFVAGHKGKVSYDPMGMSNSVQLGELKSKRIFKVL